MAFKARIIKDSINSSGNRITTFEISAPRIILSELNTHRMFSRNYSSSRAIPVKKMIDSIIADPFIPIYWGKNQSGMSASAELDEYDIIEAQRDWLHALYQSVETVENLQTIGLHKQIANRLLEPWMWVTGIITATEYDNFFMLRRSAGAQPEFKHLADMMYNELLHSRPELLLPFQWHIPMITPAEESLYSLKEQLAISTGRTARVSYLTHDGKRDPAKDIELHDKLLKDKHMSPTEHAACNKDDGKWYGNFQGWEQYRKTIPNESGVNNV
jgi:thymidylate synthase ThyX